jgi:hypothetical protein
LNLLGANVTDAGLDSLRELTNLEELNLYRTQITNAGVEKLKGLPRLRELDLRYTRVTGGGIASLTASLPKCRIAFLDPSGGQTTAGREPPPRSGPLATAKWIEQRGGKVKLEGEQIREISLASTGLTDVELGSLAEKGAGDQHGCECQSR